MRQLPELVGAVLGRPELDARTVLSGAARNIKHFCGVKHRGDRIGAIGYVACVGVLIRGFGSDPGLAHLVGCRLEHGGRPVLGSDSRNRQRIARVAREGRGKGDGPVARLGCNPQLVATRALFVGPLDDRRA